MKEGPRKKVGPDYGSLLRRLYTWRSSPGERCWDGLAGRRRQEGGGGQRRRQEQAGQTAETFFQCFLFWAAVTSGQDNVIIRPLLAMGNTSRGQGCLGGRAWGRAQGTRFRRTRVSPAGIKGLLELKLYSQPCALRL